MQTQIELILEAARQSGCQALVLSAFGCGAYGNPPGAVAKLFKEALHRHGGQLEKVVFCILNDHNSGRSHNPEGNFRPFEDIPDEQAPRRTAPARPQAAIAGPDGAARAGRPEGQTGAATRQPQSRAAGTRGRGGSRRAVRSRGLGLPPGTAG